jgi:site-specific recombinase XerD
MARSARRRPLAITASDARDRRHGNDAGDVAVLHGAAAAPPVAAPRQHGLADAFLADTALEVAAGRRSPRTWESYRKSLRVWLRHLDDGRCDDPGAATIEAFAHQHAGERSPAGLNALLDAVRALYAWCGTRGLHPAIGATIAWRPYARASVLPVLTGVQLASLLEHCADVDLRGLRDRALVLLLMDTGIATISAQRADWRHVDLDGGVLTHQPQGHRRPDCWQPFGATARQALVRYHAALGMPAPRDPLFVRISRHGRAGSRLSTLSMRLTVLRLMEHSGHATRDAQGRLRQPGAFSASCLRRSARRR